MQVRTSCASYILGTSVPKNCVHMIISVYRKVVCVSTIMAVIHVLNCNTWTKSEIKNLISLYKSMLFHLKPQN